MKPYVPISPKKFKNSGNLLKSMTNPKPGKIVFTSQISRTQYYGYFKHNWSENPNAKRLWFEYMKKLYSRQIRKVVKERVHKIK